MVGLFPGTHITGGFRVFIPVTHISEEGQFIDMIKIPCSDAEVLLKAYEDLPEKKLKMSSKVFLTNLDSRFHMEHFLECEQKGIPCGTYNASTYRNFVSDETHYALERVKRIYEKNGQTFEVTDASYNDIRKKVLEGIVKRAVYIFGRWGETIIPDASKNDAISKANLRGPLEEYIGF